MADLKGEKVQIGDKEYVVPRATVGVRWRVMELERAAKADADPLKQEQFAVDMMAALLEPNYPGVRDELLAAWSDDFWETHAAVVRAARVVKEAKPGESGSP